MASVQIPNLPAAISVTGTEQVEAVQAGTSVRITLNQIANLSNARSANDLLDEISSVQGSMLYRSDLAWSAIEPGVSGQVLTTNGADANPSWADKFYYSGIIFVDKLGSDENSGTDPSSPVLTIKRAAELAQSGQSILISPGDYSEDWPITLRRDVSVIGNNLRSVNVLPNEGFSGNDIWLVDSGVYLTGMTFVGHQAGAWAVRFNADADNTAIGASGLGAYLFKSPYVQNCTSYTAATGTGEAGSTSEGTTGGGLLVDGAACAPNSPIRSMVVDSYTQINLDGPGCLVTNDAYAQLVSFFGTFCSYHVKATLGGQVNLSNSTTDFGTQGLVANGRSATPLFQGTSGGASIGVNTIDVTNLTTNRLGNSNMPNTGQVFNVGSDYYTVTGAVPITGGYTVTFYPYLTSASTLGDTIYFSQRSQISTGGHTMEYVGAGTNYNALPWNGGVPIPANQVVEESGGRVFYSTTDELGNFKVGTQFAVNGTTGEVTINTSSFNISGLNQIGPFSRDGGITTVGVVLMEVSNNTSLLASTGAHDGNTVPTQYAVYNYLLNNYSTTSEFGLTAFSNDYADLDNLPTLGTAAAENVGYFATAAQGSLADSAVQPADLATVATTGSYNDLTDKPAISGGSVTSVDVAGGTTGMTFSGGPVTTSGTITMAGTLGVANGGTGAVTLTGYVKGSGTSALTASATIPSTDISGLAAVATTGAYGDLSGLPTLGTLSSQDDDAVSFTGSITEAVYSLTGTALDPSNGTIQVKTLSANTTLTDSLSAGEAMTLMIDDGTAYTITWPTMTWVNNAGSAPTLATSGYTVVALWKVSTTLYGALVGDGT